MAHQHASLAAERWSAESVPLPAAVHPGSFHADPAGGVVRRDRHGACRDQVPDEDVLLEAEQVVARAAP